MGRLGVKNPCHWVGLLLAIGFCFAVGNSELVWLFIIAYFVFRRAILECPNCKAQTTKHCHGAKFSILSVSAGRSTRGLMKFAHSHFPFALAMLGLVGCGSRASQETTGLPGTALVQSSPEIESVKNGVLPEHDTTTVGKAFEGTFQAAKWSSFVSPKGVTVVEFAGTAKYGALTSGGLLGQVSAPDETNFTGLSDEAKAGIQACASLDTLNAVSCIRKLGVDPDVADVPFKAQFLLSADKRHFEIGVLQLGRGVFAPDTDRLLAFIYR